ncbi:MAG: nuclease, partial [Chloroflexi bacterium]|nr:nuclease [Chloroflexota bacterium]
MHTRIKFGIVRVIVVVASLLASFFVGFTSPVQADDTLLLITGVIDGPLSGGLPKAVEFYVLKDIADLSIYGFGAANNGGGTDGEEFTFPADSATAGDFIYVATEAAGFTSFFGFAPNYTDNNAASINGDDAIELFQNGVVVDIFGDINVDGTGKPWEYLDGWAYRVDETGPDGTTFTLANWYFSGPNALDGETSNATAATPFPLGTYTSGTGYTPIYDIQYTVDPSGDSPYVGQTVTTRGIVVADFDGGQRVWIQDGAGAWNGLYLYLPSPAPAVGDLVEVSGPIQEYHGLTQLNGGTVTVLSSGNLLPDPS